MNKAAEKATISCGFTIFQNDDLFRYEDAPVSYTHLDVYKRQIKA